MPTETNASVHVPADTDAAETSLSCMEVWGGSQPVVRAVRMPGLDAWVYSRPYGFAVDGGAAGGGDVYYASSCAAGQINRLLLADVAGHGSAVAALAVSLRGVMRRHMNTLDQSRFVRAMNEQFVRCSPDGCFATAVVTTFFAPTGRLTVCNAGHPRPLRYRTSTGQWTLVEHDDVVQSDVGAGGPPAAARGPAVGPAAVETIEAPAGPLDLGRGAVRDIPLGLLERVEYGESAVDLDAGDMLLCYTDALIESRDAEGRMLGEDGLLALVGALPPTPPERLTAAVLAAIAARRPGNLDDDDVTVMLMRRPDRAPSQAPLTGRVAGMARLLGSIARRVLPTAAGGSGEAIPWPDLHSSAMGGALLPRSYRRRSGGG